jgi:hypothetical protein
MPRCPAIQEVGDNRVRWAGELRATLGFFAFPSFFLSSFLLLFATEFQEKEKMEGGIGLGRFQSKFQKLVLLPPKQFQRFATLLFYVYFNIRKGEGDFLYKIIRAK